MSKQFDTVNQQRRLAIGASLGAVGFLSTPALAQLRIDISGVGSNRFPMTVVGFVGEQGGDSMSKVLQDDLERTGRFSFVDATVQLGENLNLRNLAQIRSQGSNAVVVGQIKPQTGNRLNVSFKLIDTVRNTDLGGLAISAKSAETRQVAHRIADFVFAKLTGETGAAASRIAFVSGRTKRTLWVADADGGTRQEAVSSIQSLISPNWGLSGKRLAYVSFDGGRASVVVHDLATGNRRRVLGRQCSAPCFSPDEKTIALTVYNGAAANIVQVDLQGKNPKNLVGGSFINTSAEFSPDGLSIYFVSDRGGSPQIYQQTLSGGRPHRISFGNSQAFSPSVSPDGRWLAYVGQRNGSFRVYLLDLLSGRPQEMSEGHGDSKPSFAPNGRMLLFGAKVGGIRKLKVLATDTGFISTLSGPPTDSREPSWGPFLAG